MPKQHKNQENYSTLKKQIIAISLPRYRKCVSGSQDYLFDGVIGLINNCTVAIG